MMAACSPLDLLLVKRFMRAGTALAALSPRFPSATTDLSAVSRSALSSAETRVDRESISTLVAVDEAVRLFLSTAADHGTLREVLEDDGYRRARGEWRAPAWSSVEQRSVLAEV